MVSSFVQNIYFLRHAEGLHNARLPHGPTAGVPLTQSGIDAVQTLPEKIACADFMVKPDIIFVSPLLRTVQTAEGVKSLYPDAPMVLNDAHIEWANFDVPPNTIMTADDKKPLIDALWQRCDPDWISNEYGESFDASIKRAKRLKDDLFADNRDAILCVGHGFFIQTLALTMLGDYKSTPEIMREARLYEKLHNLDIVHVQHDRKTHDVTIQQRKYTENYAVTHAFPQKNRTHDDDRAPLI